MPTFATADPRSPVVVSIPETTSVIISLSQINHRFFKTFPGSSAFSMSFSIVKKGEKEPCDESAHTRKFIRSINVESELEAGVYFVYVSSLYEVQSETS